MFFWGIGHDKREQLPTKSKILPNPAFLGSVPAGQKSPSQDSRRIPRNPTFRKVKTSSEKYPLKTESDLDRNSVADSGKEYFSDDLFTFLKVRLRGILRKCRLEGQNQYFLGT